MKNLRLPPNNTSGAIGVWWHIRDKKWYASIHVKSKPHHLGGFKKLADAVAARKAADKKYGYHENHGSARK